MDWIGEPFMRPLKCYFGIYFPIYEATMGISTTYISSGRLNNSSWQYIHYFISYITEPKNDLHTSKLCKLLLRSANVTIDPTMHYVARKFWGECFKIDTGVIFELLFVTQFKLSHLFWPNVYLCLSLYLRDITLT